MDYSSQLRSNFESISNTLVDKVNKNEAIICYLLGEESEFIRVSNARIRQSGSVQDASLQIQLIADDRLLSFTMGLSGNQELDSSKALELLNDLRATLPGLPLDPYLTLPPKDVTSEYKKEGMLLSAENVSSVLLAPFAGLDLVGIYSAGKKFEGCITSTGCHHWYEAESFCVDFSLTSPKHRTTKLLYAGSHFDKDIYKSRLKHCQSVNQLQEKLPEDVLRPGHYRTYFGPQAVADLIRMFSWNCLSERAIQQGISPLRRMRDSGATFARSFTLSDDISSGMLPRFNSFAEKAPLSLSLINEGVLENTKVSSRSAREFEIETNFSTPWEGIRIPRMEAGTLAEQQILSSLDTGLYISNLHYLNWSDPVAGRVTGLSRHSCFLVEKGEKIACMPTMRFDDTIFSLFGSSLEAASENLEFIPETSTYSGRSTGGSYCPGMLVSRFEITL